MQIGIVLAIKTLADRFEPLNEVYRDFIGEAVLAEELGFDFASTSEHHFQADAWSPSQLPVLAYLAARTSRMRLHTNVFLLPLHDPLRVSEDAATVDILPNGRLDLICGSGSVDDEFKAWGLDHATRWGRLFEGLTEPPTGMMAPLLGTPDDILAALEPELKDSDCTHFSFAFRASGGGMPTEMVRPTIKLFAAEILPVLRGWGREPRTSRAQG